MYKNEFYDSDEESTERKIEMVRYLTEREQADIFYRLSRSVNTVVREYNDNQSRKKTEYKGMGTVIVTDELNRINNELQGLLRKSTTTKERAKSLQAVITYVDVEEFEIGKRWLYGNIERILNK